MLALGARLASRGHEVSFETWRRWSDHVQASGMRFIPAPEYPVFPTRERPLRPYEAVVRSAGETRRSIADAKAEVVVHDILTLAPAMAGELEGVPVATLIPHVHPSSPPGFPPYALGARLPRTPVGRSLWRALEGVVQTGLRQGRAELNDARGRLGLEPVERLHGGISAALAIVGTLPQLEYPRSWPKGTHVVGPLMWEPPFGEVPVPPGDAPLVLIAPSTAQDPEQQLLMTAVEALGDQPVRVLATTNRKPLPRPLSIAPNTELVEWVSYSRTMPRCSLVICHGGHGTVVRALSSGAPVLVVPHSGDMGENAARIDWAGLGVRLPWRLLSPATLRLAVKRVLANESFATRALELAEWAVAHDGAERAADLVERLGGQRAEAEP